MANQINLSKSGLLNKLNDIEWDDFEVKLAEKEIPNNIWETVSAFANTAGGWIVFGVAQKGKKFIISGIENAEKIEQDFLNCLRSNQKFNTNIEVDSKKYTFLENDKTLIVIAFYIHMSENKPVFYGNNVRNSFIRKASSDNRANESEINAMYRDQVFGKITSKTIENSSFYDINKTSFDSYRRYLKDINPYSKYALLNDEEFIEKLQITIAGKLTYGGLLMFGKNEIINKYISDFRIDYLEIPANSYNEANPRYTYRIEEQENIWEYYFALFQRLKLYADNPFAMDSMGFAYESSPQLEALREALVNMLMHADYFSLTKSRIRIFNNRIEFENAGSFPLPIEELLKSDISIPRNPIIAKLFRCVKLAENAGFGFDKMLVWEKETKNKVEFENLIYRSKVIFYRKEENVNVKPSLNNEKVSVNDENVSVDVSVKSKIVSVNKVQKRLNDIIELMKEKPSISIKDIANKLCVEERTVYRDIAKLKEENIARIGADKNGYWKVIKPIIKK